MMYLPGFGGFYACNGLSGKHSNGQCREPPCRKQTGEFYVFWPFSLFLISKVKFSFQTKREQTGTKNQGAVFVCFVFLTCSPFFFLVPNSHIECLAPRGEAEGEVFLTFPVISLVLYFFGVQKPCRDIIREFREKRSCQGARAKSVL